MEDRMSKISDEVRKVADEYDVLPLLALADRVDHELVELPRDRDGVPIHVGDKVYLDDWRMACVTEIDIKRECEVIYCFDGSKYEAHHPSLTTHERPDSFERIADDLDEVVDAAGKADDMCEMLANFADRIRKLAKEDER